MQHESVHIVQIFGWIATVRISGKWSLRKTSQQKGVLPKWVDDRAMLTWMVYGAIDVDREWVLGEVCWQRTYTTSKEELRTKIHCHNIVGRCPTH
jgi:hypothetical protein